MHLSNMGPLPPGVHYIRHADSHVRDGYGRAVCGRLVRRIDGALDEWGGKAIIGYRPTCLDCLRIMESEPIHLVKYHDGHTISPICNSYCGVSGKWHNQGYSSVVIFNGKEAISDREFTFDIMEATCADCVRVCYEEAKMNFKGIRDAYARFLPPITVDTDIEELMF